MQVTVYGDPVAARDAEIAELRAALDAQQTAISSGGLCLANSGLYFPDGSCIDSDGVISGPLAKAIAGKS